jgi:hypothetical protein
MHAAHQQIDAEIAGERDPPQFGLPRHRDHFHPWARAGLANDRGQALQHRRVSADVLEADMPQSKRARDLNEIQSILVASLRVNMKTKSIDEAPFADFHDAALSTRHPYGA